MKTISRYIMTLALLITAVGGAWAQTETLLTTITATAKEQASYSTANVATVSFSNLPSTGGNTYGSDYLAAWGWYGYGFTATVTAAEGYTITKCIFYDDANRTATDSESPFVVETTEEDKTPRINGTPIDGGNMQSKGIKMIEVYGYETPAEPTIDVTTNAASEQDLFTEAKFTMPAFDATAEYELVRDMQDETNPVAFNGLPSSGNIVVKKGDDGKYQPIEALNIQLIDPVAAAEAQNIIAADGLTVKVLVGNGGTPIEYDQEPPITLDAFLADMKPGYYWIKAEPTDENSPYDGTVYSSEFTVVEQYDLTVKPANDFSKGKVESVTVGSGSVTIDANTGKATKTGIAPDTEVKIKAKRGYVIDKVEVKKGIAPPDPVTVTWNNLNFNSNPYTRDGVTLTAGNAASGNNFYDWGEKTFTNTIGKFTKIEIVCGDYNLDGWAQQKVGEYSDPEGPTTEIFKLTWTGNAESVTIPGKYVYNIQSITFTIQ